MKNLLLLFFVLIFGSIQAQTYQKIINNKIEKINKQLKDIDLKTGDYKICAVEEEENGSGVLEIIGNAKYSIKTK